MRIRVGVALLVCLGVLAEGAERPAAASVIRFYHPSEASERIELSPDMAIGQGDVNDEGNHATISWPYFYETGPATLFDPKPLDPANVLESLYKFEGGTLAIGDDWILPLISLELGVFEQDPAGGWGPFGTINFVLGPGPIGPQMRQALGLSKNATSRGGTGTLFLDFWDPSTKNPRDGGNANGNDQFSIDVVPEPATLSLVLVGGIAFVARRRVRERIR